MELLMVKQQRKLRRVHHRNTLTKACFLILIACCVAQVARSAEIWIVRGGGSTRVGCAGVAWSADALLHNRSTTDVAVRALHVSNGGVALTDAIIVANSSMSSADAGVGGTANAFLWVTKLDIPEGITAEGRLEYFTANFCAVGQPPPLAPAGKISLPVFSRLVPAGEEQVHFGTDLGGQIVRLNVAIFNAATVPANATITVVQPVCGRVPATMTGTVPSDSIVQLGIPRIEPCLAKITSLGWASYVTVTVDQPSFSFVSTLRNDTLPSTTAAVVP